MNPESYQKKPEISTEIIIKVIKATCSEAFYYECTNCALFVMKILFSSYPKSAAAIFFLDQDTKEISNWPTARGSKLILMQNAWETKVPHLHFTI